MSVEWAIRVEGVGKRYLIGKKKEGNLRETLTNLFGLKTHRGEEFWALKNLTFEIKKGDVVGIIGKNGAGKSTLLKILSQITRPSEGRISINGRLASLLEVGTGFHPELTGRENIFLNGTILGMTRKEVAQKLDEIIAFSGVEKFIDTPVKHYSSGMYVRLAFAVAAHLEPEILVIDEVLAVGDAEFQKKCLGKMQDVANEGRTVLFVSHNLDAVQTLCTKGILLHKGEIKLVGSIADVLTQYADNYQMTAINWKGNDRPGDDIVRLEKIEVIDQDQKRVEQVSISQKIGIRIIFEVLRDNESPTPNVHFFTQHGVYCFVAIDEVRTYQRGLFETTLWINGELLNNISYSVGVAMTTLQSMLIHCYERDVVSINVVENKLLRRSSYGGEYPGILRPHFTFETRELQTTEHVKN